MVIVDSSAWIEFLRGTGSETDAAVQDLIKADEIVICDPVIMELLAGARSDANLNDLKRLLWRSTVISPTSSDYEQAAAMYRVCRRSGETVRKMIDCLIASVAVTAGLPVLHADGDFDVLARHTALQSFL